MVLIKTHNKPGNEPGPSFSENRIHIDSKTLSQNNFLEL